MKRNTQDRWIAILHCIENGQTVVCPWCNEAEIQMEHTIFENGNATAFLSCPACRRLTHFSHYKDGFGKTNRI